MKNKENEVEVKILEVEKQKISDQLYQLGAKLIFDGTIKGVFFDTPKNRLDENNQILRLRTEGDETILTYKKKSTQDNVRSNTEYEVLVADFKKTKQIFLELGYVEKYPQEKHRLEYKLKGCKVVIDEYSGRLCFIPPFIEIEAMANSRTEALERITECANKLGYSKERFKDWTTKELEEHYNSKN